MSRVTLSLLAAAAMTFVAAGSANAQCCNSGFAMPVVSYPSACCNSGFAFGGGYAVQAAPVVVQAAPVVVQAQPVVVQQPVIVKQPVLVQQPVVVQQQPVVQQYVVNQGPVYSGPGLSDPRYGTYYAPRAVGAYPYAAGLGGRWGYRRAYYGPRPHWHARRAYHRHYHHNHGPISVNN
ncbi:hypothetical protein [Pseudorhodoplanes sp.]|uniref:hypothetical protein n=1 Tax=Pseudorhodoplanes sp. TaxID=1934341 RepID=UPI002BF419EA|nr:hypothetical protein [Pseudorhodoplanes sp.]HWV52808.1 hypothetical protein [Pseudorhodoplanes sp.]